MNEVSINDLHDCFLNSKGVCTDTRNIIPGSLFIALKGDNFDGNKFVLNAINSGAKYALTSNLELADGKTIFYAYDTLVALQNLANYHRKQFNIPVIGITGSNGKTTTKELFYVVLSKKYNTLATKGNLNNHIGVPLTLLNLNENHEMAIIEMGANHQGEIALLCSIAAPNYGLITNIGKAHLEGFGGIEGVIKGKTEMYKYLLNKNGVVFYNADNTTLSEQVKLNNGITYAFNNEANCKGKIVNDAPFIAIQYSFKQGNLINVDTKLIGVYNAENILSAICVGKYFDVEDRLITSAIAEYNPDNSRSQILKIGSNTIVLDAYNANPSSMKAALDNFAKMQVQKKISILGDMFELGENSAIEHEQIILEALKGNYFETIFIGPRFSAFKDKYKARFFESTEQCINYLKALQKVEITFLIKGSRGMKLEVLLDTLNEL